jgi:hypothetical protein
MRSGSPGRQAIIDRCRSDTPGRTISHSTSRVKPRSSAQASGRLGEGCCCLRDPRTCGDLLGAQAAPARLVQDVAMSEATTLGIRRPKISRGETGRLVWGWPGGVCLGLLTLAAQRSWPITLIFKGFGWGISKIRIDKTRTLMGGRRGYPLGVVAQSDAASRHACVRSERQAARTAEARQDGHKGGPGPRSTKHRARGRRPRARIDERLSIGCPRHRKSRGQWGEKVT